MELTMDEKRSFLKQIRDLTLENVIRKEDRDDIYRVCLAACARELEKLRQEE